MNAVPRVLRGFTSLILAALLSGCPAVLDPGEGPLAAFTTGPTSGFAPLAVQFTDQSQAGTESILTWRWTFGDGTSLTTTSLGEPYPAESDIQHVYEQSSLAAGGTYTVTVQATFSARYRVNGGPWQSLEPISRSFTTDYPVQQLQSVLTGR